jgi:hypothetical protein
MASSRPFGARFSLVLPLAADLTRGKGKITVRFQAASGSEVPGVFGVRVVRAEDVR